MGYLHEGHLSLVRLAKKENDAVVVSLFVNPLQFGPSEDFRRYPRDLRHDRRKLAPEKTDFLFLPSAEALTARDFQTTVSVSRLSKPLCGRTRPSHFAGVTTIVLKLLNLVGPDRLYLGQKDYQQFLVVRQMIRDMNFPCRVKLAPIVREPDGLAMSSRNVFLSSSERREAVLINRMLEQAEALIRAGSRNPARIKRKLRASLKRAAHARLDYLEIVDAETLVSVIKLKPGLRVLVAVAVFFGKTRLIDNRLIKV